MCNDTKRCLVMLHGAGAGAWSDTRSTFLVVGCGARWQSLIGRASRQLMRWHALDRCLPVDWATLGVVQIPHPTFPLSEDEAGDIWMDIKLLYTLHNRNSAEYLHLCAGSGQSCYSRFSMTLKCIMRYWNASAPLIKFRGAGQKSCCSCNIVFLHRYLSSIFQLGGTYLFYALIALRFVSSPL